MTSAPRFLARAVVTELALGLSTVLSLASAQSDEVDIRAHVPKFEPPRIFTGDYLLVPVMTDQGTTMTGPDGKERCLALTPPTGPRVATTAHLDGLDTDDLTGAMAGVDRPVTIADTIPCE